MTIVDWPADPAWRMIDLLSDVHLQSDLPRTFEAWRGHLLGTPADAVLILGDLFEVWVGDDARCDGFERACADVLHEASQHRTLAFLPGNRDFLVGSALLGDTGVQALADPFVLVAFGRRWLLSHGDALCLADADYQQFRRQVRSVAWQQQFLAQPLAARRLQARAMRDASTLRQAGIAPGLHADVDGAAACAWLEAANAEALIHGHTHRPATHMLPCGRQRHVLGDWDFDTAVPRARALRLTRDGLSTLDLAPAAPA